MNNFSSALRRSSDNEVTFCAYPHLTALLRKMRLFTVSTLFCFRQNQNAPAWNVLAVLANHSRYPLFRAKRWTADADCDWLKQLKRSTTGAFCSGWNMTVFKHFWYCFLSLSFQLCIQFKKWRLDATTAIEALSVVLDGEFESISR